MKNNIDVINEIKIRKEDHPLNVISAIENTEDAWIYISQKVIDFLYKEAFYHGRYEENDRYQFLTFHETEKHPWKSILYSRGEVNGWFLYAGNYREHATEDLPHIPKVFFYIDMEE